MYDAGDSFDDFAYLWQWRRSHGSPVPASERWLSQRPVQAEGDMQGQDYLDMVSLVLGT